MKHLKISSIALLALLAACSPQTDSAASSSDATASSANYSSFDQQKQAQDIINQAIQAAGGMDALSGLASGKTTFSVRAARIGQAATPEANGDLGNPSKTVAQRANGLVAIDRFNGDNLGSRYIHGGCRC